ncbi:hypothetical protein O6H91_10G099200 [Diphasiastrum complanatum]|uniref:Uncharacterized protein n=1 Tax=Diphasiastrum complanatum TaxID=34168 RepID=A0ACC2CJS4_DIPCM|nr:hypothetical protein O6H91_10G099200 [Diphasiastrum complanatum]
MGMIGDAVAVVRGTNVRHLLMQVISLGLIVSSALIIWKGLMCLTGSEPPVVVVLSGRRPKFLPTVDSLISTNETEPRNFSEIFSRFRKSTSAC